MLYKFNIFKQIEILEINNYLQNPFFSIKRKENPVNLRLEVNGFMSRDEDCRDLFFDYMASND